MRSRRQPSILAFLAQDEQSQSFCYSNANLRKGEEADEIFAFIAFWEKAHGQRPKHLDFDMALLVVASGLYRLLARRMRGYADAQARRIFQDLVDMPAQVQVSDQEVRVQFHPRAHLPIVLASGLCDRPVAIPWWEGRRLRLTTYTGR
jgi:hypothetical protein